MDNQSLQKIKDIIAKSQKVSIALRPNPSVDQMAAALSLYLTLTSLNKKVTVLSPTEPIVELSSLVGIDKVRTSNEGTSGDLVVSFPYREGEIEKVSYTIDEGFLNIVVKAGEQGLTFTEQDVMFRRGADKADLVITVGTSSMNDLTGLFTEESLKDATIINLDNSVQNEGFGDVVLVSDKFSSVSEQVADLFLNLGMDIDIDVAQNLLSGITASTNNFQSPNTSYLAFEIAAYLLKRGAVRSRQGLPKQEERQPALSQVPQSRLGQRQPFPRRNEAQAQKTETRQDNRQGDQKPPSDWLTPKVYKGSTSV